MIGYFVYRLDSYSGAAQQALLLAQHVRQNVFIFNHNGKGYRRRKETESVTIVDLPESRVLQILIVSWLSIRNRVTTFHFHGYFIFGMALGVLLRRRLILKTTLLGDDDFDSLSKKRFARLRAHLLRAMDINVVLSDRMLEINSKHVRADKVMKIPNGVLLPNRACTMQDKTNTFCFVGLVCERKNTLKSLEYFCKHYSSDPTARMYIVGPFQGLKANEEVDNQYIETCLEFVRKNGLESQVIFTGNLSKDETNNIFRKSKALLFFSEREGMPNVVLEAMAHNCVPIVTEMAGVANELLKGSRAGYIVSDVETHVNLESIESSIKENLPYELVKELYSAKIISNQYFTIYSRLAGLDQSELISRSIGR